MDIPDLVRQQLGGEEVQAGVSLGDEDAVCLTPTRTLIYRGEGLLSDEQVEEYSHNVERLSVSDGRRKTKFVLQYVDGTESFTVPSNRGDNVLELLLEGVFRVAGVIDDRESVVGVYRFSELTLVITEQRLIKHIGEPVWDEDYEAYHYEDVTGLEFEEASVATSIALVVDGRPQRIKVPNDEARVVRQKLENALFDFYDVGSLDELNAVVDDREGGVEADDEPERDDLDFGGGIDPLVTDDAESEAPPAEGRDAGAPPEQGGAASGQRGGDQRADAGRQSGRQQPDRRQATERSPDAGQSAEASQSADAARGSTESQSAESSQRGGPGDRSQSEAAGQRAESERQQSAGTSTAQSSGRTAEQRTNDAGAGTERDDSGISTRQPTTDSQADRTASADEQAGDDRSGEAGGPGGEVPSVQTSGSGTSEQSVEDAAAELEAAVSQEDLDEVSEQLADLTEAVDRQNEVLKRQHRAIEQLVEQLQSR